MQQVEIIAFSSIDGEALDRAFLKSLLVPIANYQEDQRIIIAHGVIGEVTNVDTRRPIRVRISTNLATSEMCYHFLASGQSDDDWKEVSFRPPR